MEFGADLRAGLNQLFHWRRDVRRFRTDPIEPTRIARLLATSTAAPSVGLSEPWRFVILEDPEVRTAARQNFEPTNAAPLNGYDGDKRQLYASLKLSGMEDAPVQIAVFCDEGSDKGDGLGIATMPEMLRYSVVCAIHQIWLAARADGIGMGWVSIIDPVRLTRDLRVPSDWHLIAYLCLGFPTEDHLDPELERAGWEARTPAHQTVLTR